MSTKGRGEGVRDQLFIYFYFFLFFYFYLLLSDSCPKKQKLKSWKTKMSKKNRKSFWGEKKEQWSFAFDTYRWWIYCVCTFKSFIVFLPVQHRSLNRVGVPPTMVRKRINCAPCMCVSSWLVFYISYALIFESIT